jgi:hypothetical protein
MPNCPTWQAEPRFRLLVEHHHACNLPTSMQSSISHPLLPARLLNSLCPQFNSPSKVILHDGFQDSTPSWLSTPTPSARGDNSIHSRSLASSGDRHSRSLWRCCLWGFCWDSYVGGEGTLLMVCNSMHERATCTWPPRDTLGVAAIFRAWQCHSGAWLVDR